MRRKKGQVGKTAYSFSVACVHAVCAVLGTELLFQGVLYLFSSELAGWSISMGSYTRLQILLLLSIFLFEIVVPASGTYRSICKVALEIGYPVLIALYALRNVAALAAGGQALFNDYLPYWNAQYHTNYVGFDANGVDKAAALAFVIGAFFLLCLMLRYVTGARFILLLPDLAALAVGLLVDAKPEWRALAFFFVGMILVYAAPWDSERIVWHKKDTGETGFFGSGQLLSFFATAVFSVLLVSVSGYAFLGAANRIPEHKHLFYAFQQKVEERVKSLDSLGISFVQNRADVDNRTPEYKGDTVLTLQASEQPQYNLYMKRFDSGTFKNNGWSNDDGKFVQAAKQNGYNGAQTGMLLQQEVYAGMENQKDDLLELLIKSDYLYSVPDSGDVTYQLTYAHAGSKDALLPYFARLPDQERKITVEGDGVARKKRNTREVTVKGTAANADFLFDQNLNELVSTMGQEKNADLYQWYSEYVIQQYRGRHADVPSVGRFVNKNAGQFENSVYRSQVYQEDGGFFVDQMMDDWMENEGDEVEEGTPDWAAQVNDYRLSIAQTLQYLLSDTATYNLYLDDIPQGTGTIDYFLETGKEGYCMHFASAGALILQELGVPARYASGYVAKPSDFHQKGEQYTAEIPDYNAHAWVEIYLEHIGWVPVEMTPGYSDVVSKVPTDPAMDETLRQKHQAQVKRRQEEQNQEEAPQPTQSESGTQEASQQPESGNTKQDGSRPDKPSAKNKIPLLILEILLPLLVLLLVYWQRKNYRERLFAELRRRQNRRAVCRINRRIYRRLLGRTIGIKTDSQYLQKLLETYPDIRADDWERYMQIMQKAVYSKEEITQEETKFCYRIYQNCHKKP